ncbi:BglG family transcription antiterminator [Thermoanaerobacterium thermosaccharolyticum]|uniref:Transcriptional antiterminator, BglG family n=1 Tax=Thermoanaerobacterium thermosaccharolyticum M0795 TaxID=698948 RepID=L0IG96_THETR|nr:BglG family transcription antiterminator [Thermoanaerobacterium thermosaccharolyticum]AGB18565.1 transcriptional antiterminator, BglG family [Thermoanaerobacterium thermosaccharolyticum M0795]
MISLTKRQIEFIKLLLEETNYKTIKSFADLLNASNKTIQKDLRVIEKYLNKFNIILDRKRGTGIMIVNAKNAKWLLLNDLERQERRHENISIKERRIEIIKNLLISSHMSTSIQKLSDMYYVSKTSIVNDLNYIEKWISQFNLKLEKNKKGTRIVGTENDIRRAIESLLIEYSKEVDKDWTIEELTARIDASTLNALLEIFEKDKIIYVNELLVKLEKKYNCLLNDPYYINILTHILISLTRGLEGKQIEVDVAKRSDNMKYEKAYEEAKNIVNQINKDFQTQLGESEIYYLYQYFISSGLVKNMSENANEVLNELNQRANIFAKKVTSFMEKIMNINILNDEIVMEGLLMHIRPMLNRLDYDIQISNPVIGDIIEEYPDILNMCKAAVLMATYDLKLKMIPMDEIGYLALYYQLALERSIVKRRILVVCQSGYGTSQLLSARIRRAFPDWEIVDILSVSMLKERNMDDIDFIVSTVPIDIKEKPYILVSTFLNDQDIQNISKLLVEKPVKTDRKQIGTLYINQYLTEENIYFNKQYDEVVEQLNKKYQTNINFHEISLGDDIKVEMGFYSNQPILAIALNDVKKLKKQIVFYIAMDNTDIITHLLSEIYHLHTFEGSMYYLKKCMNGKDVKNYFELNEGEMKIMATDLAKVIKIETIKLDMEAKTKDEVLRELTTLLYNAGALSDKEAFLDDVYYRERLGSTGIGNGIAIPHGKSKFVNKTSLAIGRTKTDIEWETLDNKPVRFIILFAVKDENRDSAHIRLLSQVATKLADDEVCEKLQKVKTPEEIYQIFAGE